MVLLCLVLSGTLSATGGLQFLVRVRSYNCADDDVLRIIEQHNIIVMPIPWNCFLVFRVEYVRIPSSDRSGASSGGLERNRRSGIVAGVDYHYIPSSTAIRPNHLIVLWRSSISGHSPSPRYSTGLRTQLQSTLRTLHVSIQNNHKQDTHFVTQKQIRHVFTKIIIDP